MDASNRRGGEALPIFLDEALTTSDTERFAVMAQTLTELSHSENRQLFYLTARPAEADFWQAATKKEVQHIELAEIRGERKASDMPAYTMEKRKIVPSPSAHTPKDYAEMLKVEKIDPWNPPKTHLFHLFQDDLELLYRIINRYHLVSLSQLDSFLQSSAETDTATKMLRSPEKVCQMRLRCAIAKSWMEAWKEGKGKPLTPSLLLESRLVSGIFQKTLCTQCEKFGGNAKSLIAWLKQGKMRGYSDKRINKLEIGLCDQGYIVEKRESLNPDELFTRCLGEVSKPSGADREGELLGMDIFKEVRDTIAFLEAGISSL